MGVRAVQRPRARASRKRPSSDIFGCKLRCDVGQERGRAYTPSATAQESGLAPPHAAYAPAESSKRRASWSNSCGLKLYYAHARCRAAWGNWRFGWRMHVACSWRQGRCSCAELQPREASHRRCQNLRACVTASADHACARARAHILAPLRPGLRLAVPAAVIMSASERGRGRAPAVLPARDRTSCRVAQQASRCAPVRALVAEFEEPRRSRRTMPQLQLSPDATPTCFCTPDAGSARS